MKPVPESLAARLEHAAARLPQVPSDLVLAGFLLAIVVMMIVPVPPTILDFLIALNIATSVGLLLVALYVQEASRLATLPSLLLLATLFRLGLNVSTTRLVLLSGDAGRIVDAFGRIVVGGNIVVGGVVFLVLALVQFVVIAKGSERVAEVAARFTLDALPGKQMAIDADLRAGSMSLEEAQDRRRSLERESQLYGALDGAMKFVKGDAVAGLIVVAVNIAGGLAVGVLQKGMTLAGAASHYTVLTVGDGLAAQIPSLLVSTTAGLIVTRVPSGDRSNLGGDITTQVGAQPRALLLTAGLLGLVAVMPGLPALPFVGLGAAAALAGLAGLRAGSKARPDESRDRRPPSDQALVLRHAESVSVRLGGVDEAQGGLAAQLEAEIVPMRATLYAALGLRFPNIEIERSEELPPNGFEIASGGSVLASGTVPDHPSWVRARLSSLSVYGVAGREHDGLVWTDADGSRAASDAGFEIGSAGSYLARRLEAALRSSAGDFVGVQECRDLVDMLETTHPALVAEVLPRLLSLAQVAEVLRRLASEGVSIRDLRTIFEALATAAQQERDPVQLAEAVRWAMRRQITATVAAGRQSLPVYALAPSLEETIRDAARYAMPGGPVPLDAETVRLLLDQLRSLESTEREPSAVAPVVVTSADLRRHVRSLVEGEHPDLRVLSYQDLMPSVVLQPIATVG